MEAWQVLVQERVRDKAEEWWVAADAFRRFGRGRHAAGLNFGDCLAYAMARTSRDTLLYVGQDFSKTDSKPAAP